MLELILILETHLLLVKCLFFEKTKNYILNIHLKDYIILPTKQGFELNRCPIMDGDSDILKIISLIKKYKLNLIISFELGIKFPGRLI